LHLKRAKLLTSAMRSFLRYARYRGEVTRDLAAAVPHTISSYRDTFRQFLKFVQQRLHTPPSRLNLEEINAPLIVAFLDGLEKQHGLSVRSRNLRLTAIQSFLRDAAFEAPAHSAQIQRVLAIHSKRFTRTLVQFLTRAEVDALLAAPDQRTWFGRRDHAFLLVAVQTGLRVSEMTGLTREDLVVGAGAHVRVIGKGRKERCTPIARSTLAVVKAWLREPQRGSGDVLFPSAKGKHLSIHGVQYLLNKHRMTAAKVCPSLKDKRVTVHRLRHTMAMDLLQAGVDRAVIALWLGHESVETTQIYLEATLAMKEQALAKATPPNGRAARYHVGRALTPEEQKRLFDKATSNPEWEQVYCAAILAANTSMRGVEIKNLRRRDVDLEKALLHIRRSKNETSHRLLPLNAPAKTAVERMLARADALGHTDPTHYLWPANQWHQFDPTQPAKKWDTAWRVLRDAAGLPGLRFHDLRHTVITELLEAGEPDHVVESISGHLSRRMLEHYSHIRIDAKKGALDRLDKSRKTARGGL
jgi:site-specific recombinase XerD